MSDNESVPPSSLPVLRVTREVWAAKSVAGKLEWLDQFEVHIVSFVAHQEPGMIGMTRREIVTIVDKGAWAAAVVGNNFDSGSSSAVRLNQDGSTPVPERHHFSNGSDGLLISGSAVRTTTGKTWRDVPLGEPPPRGARYRQEFKLVMEWAEKPRNMEKERAHIEKEMRLQFGGIVQSVVFDGGLS